MNKYRLFIVVCLSLLLWQGVQAQRIHEILFCNTIDRSIGKSVEIDNDRALDEIGCIGGYIGYEVVEHVYQGKDCTRKNLINLLETLDCSNILLLQWSRCSRQYEFRRQTAADVYEHEH